MEEENITVWCTPVSFKSIHRGNSSWSEVKAFKVTSGNFALSNTSVFKLNCTNERNIAGRGIYEVTEYWRCAWY